MVRDHGFRHGWNAWFRHGHGGRHSTMRMAYILFSRPADALQSIHLFQSYCRFFVTAEISVCFVSFLHAHH